MSEWISVKDRLPEYTAQAMGSRFAAVLVAMSGVVTEGLYEEGKFIALSANVTHHVTHWMPLPKPPEET